MDFVDVIAKCAADLFSTVDGSDFYLGKFLPVSANACVCVNLSNYNYITVNLNYSCNRNSRSRR